jgi:hypothetical protein
MGRQSLDERTEAIAVVIGLLLGEPTAVQNIEAAGTATERFLGVDRGRRFRLDGSDPWLSGPPGDGLDFLGLQGGFNGLIALIENATDTELDSARTACRTLLAGVAAFSRIADALTGRDNASGMGAIRLLSEEDDPHMGLVMPGFFLCFTKSPVLANNLIDVTNAITTAVMPVDALMTELVNLPQEERSARLAALDQMPFPHQLPIKRLLVDYEAFVKGLNSHNHHD